MDEMHEHERLSLQASSVIAELADQERARTGCDYAEAFRRVLARERHLAAGLAGDVREFQALTRSTRMAAAPRERQFRRAGPPRAISRRAIRDRSEQRANETVCVHLTAGEPSLFAEVIA